MERARLALFLTGGIGGRRGGNAQEERGVEQSVATRQPNLPAMADSATSKSGSGPNLAATRPVVAMAGEE